MRVLRPIALQNRFIHFMGGFRVFLPFSCETIHKEMCLAYMFIAMQIKFSYKRFCTKTRFETEAQGKLGNGLLFGWFHLAI